MLHGPKKADPARSVFFVPPCLPLDTIPPCSNPPVVPRTPNDTNMLGLLFQSYPLCMAPQAQNDRRTESHNRENATTRERDEAMSPLLPTYDNAITRERDCSRALPGAYSLTREREKPRTRRREYASTRRRENAIMDALASLRTSGRCLFVVPITRYRNVACFLERELARTRHRVNGICIANHTPEALKTRQRLNATFRERHDATSR